MSKKYSSVKQKRGEELIRFATVLQNSSIPCDLQSLTDAGGKCHGFEPAGKGSWGYNIEGLLLHNPDEVSHVRPTGAKLTSIQINVRLIGRCNVANGFDPIQSLGVEIILNGTANEEGKTVSLRSSWYMDRYDATSDRISEEGSDNRKCPVHPHYHIQFGGKNVKSVSPGKLIVASPPRIAHPPMDALLATDFVISNYFSSEWLKLRTKSTEYLPLIKESQKGYWLPYADALKRNWNRPSRGDVWEAVDLWPQL